MEKLLQEKAYYCKSVLGLKVTSKLISVFSN